MWILIFFEKFGLMTFPSKSIIIKGNYIFYQNPKRDRVLCGCEFRPCAGSSWPETPVGYIQGKSSRGKRLHKDFKEAREVRKRFEEQERIQSFMNARFVNLAGMSVVALTAKLRRMREGRIIAKGKAKVRREVFKAMKLISRRRFEHWRDIAKIEMKIGYAPGQSPNFCVLQIFSFDLFIDIRNNVAQQP